MSRKGRGADSHGIVRPGCDCHIHGAVDGGGEYEAFVVVGVLSDEVDAARRAEQSGRLSVGLDESGHKPSGDRVGFRHSGGLWA